MLREFFKSVSDFCTKESLVIPQVLPFRAKKRGSYYWNPELKEVVELTDERPDNRHKFLSVDSIVEYVKGFGTTCNIWIGPSAITVECEENNPKDVVRMELRHSTMFALLCSLRDKPSRPQNDAVKLLRQQLSPFDPGSKALTASRSLKLSKGDDFEAETSHVSNRIGKSVMQQASGAGDLPEFIDVISNVYLKGGKEGHTVRVWLSIDFSKPGNILFEPDDAQMEEAMLAERLELVAFFGDALDSSKVKVYEGEYFVS